MKLDHICFAVSDIKDAMQYWHSVFGYRQMTKIVINSQQKVKVVFLCNDDSLPIKLIEPLDNRSALYNFAKRGGGFHHLCFQCRDINNRIGDLTQLGMKVLVPPQPGEAFSTSNIAFLLARFGLKIELIDNEEKADVLEH